ncbi:MAG: sulfite exporter TauE/SafE family protein [Marinilabiliaceae bacterium]|nr:sulfite exporter TauE/SafE family protein [Marinilabiliaceae bacterium]
MELNISQVIILLAIGLASGFLSGTMGVGGGIIVVPALVYFLGFSQHMAQGTSLALLLPPTGILATMHYYKNGYVDVKVALILVIMFIVGAYLGSLLSLNIPAKVLKKIFAFFIIIAATKMMFEK